MLYDNPDWKCNQKKKNKEVCGKKAAYHTSEGRKKQYYCTKHWSIKLGFKEEK